MNFLFKEKQRYFDYTFHKRGAVVFLCAIIWALMLVGCAKAEATEYTETTESGGLTIADLFPFNDNVFYQYEGEGNNYAAWDIYIDYINGNKIQRRIVAGAMTVAEVLEYTDGQLWLRYSEPRFNRHEDVTGYEPNTEVLILQEPIELGAKWKTYEGEESEITAVDAEVETPYGTFKSAVEVTNTTANSVTKEYYVKNIGHVKTVTENSELGESSTSLFRMEQDAKLTGTLTIYNYSAAGEVSQEERSFEIGTNEGIILILNSELKKTSADGSAALLPADANINFISYDAEDESITVVLSGGMDAVVSEGTENQEFNSLLDTLGNFYKAKLVCFQTESGTSSDKTDVNTYHE